MIEMTPVIPETETKHPVIIQYTDKIQQLETSLASTKDELDTMRMRWQSVLTNKGKFENDVKNALVSAWNDDQDQATITYIADMLNIDLSVRKKFEINVTHEIEVELPIGDVESFDPEWHIDFSAISNFGDIIYSEDSIVIYSKEIS